MCRHLTHSVTLECVLRTYRTYVLATNRHRRYHNLSIICFRHNTSYSYLLRRAPRAGKLKICANMRR